MPGSRALKDKLLKKDTKKSVGSKKPTFKRVSVKKIK